MIWLSYIKTKVSSSDLFRGSRDSRNKCKNDTMEKISYARDLISRILAFLIIILFCPLTFAAQPYQAPASPVAISGAITILSIDKINDKADEFNATVRINTSWHDLALAFNKISAGVDHYLFNDSETSKKLDQIWNPKIDIVNVKGETHSSHQGLTIYSDGKVNHVRTVAATFSSILNTEAFPFDQAQLQIKLRSLENNIQKIHLSVNKKALGNLFQQNMPLWSIGDLRADITEARGWDNEIYQTFVFSINISRYSAPYTAIIILPFLLILLVPTLQTWTTHTNKILSLSLIFSAILALITLQYTTTFIFPVIPTLNSTFIKLLGLGYAYLLLILFIIFFLTEKQHYLEGKYYLQELLGFLKWGIPLIFTVLLLSIIVLA